VRRYFDPEFTSRADKKGHELALFLFIYRIERCKQHIDNNNNINHVDDNSKASAVASDNIG
jgi:hypothetical protein